MSLFFPFQRVAGLCRAIVRLLCTPSTVYTVRQWRSCTQLFHCLTYTEHSNPDFPVSSADTHIHSNIIVIFQEIFCVMTVSKYISIWEPLLTDDDFRLEKQGCAQTIGNPFTARYQISCNDRIHFTITGLGCFSILRFFSLVPTLCHVAFAPSCIASLSARQLTSPGQNSTVICKHAAH